MTRFSVKKGSLDASSIDDEQLEILLQKTTDKYERKLRTIAKRNVLIMKKENLNYRLKLCGKEFVIVIKREDSKFDELCIGYPFPIYSKILNKKEFNGFLVRYFIRGKTLRKFQREHLINQLKCGRNGTIRNFVSKTQFLNSFKKDMKDYQNKSAYYFDYYNFLGDSLLNTYMYDNFINNYSLNKVFYVSKNFSHLSCLYNVINNIPDEWNRIEDDSIYIMGDILDIDSGYVNDFIINSNKDGIYILNSRNIYLIKKGKDVLINIYDKEDVLLINDNIFKYMNDCVSPFVNFYNTNRINHIDKLRDIKLFLNPYASSVDKSLNIEEVIKIIEYIKTNFIAQIFMPAGYDENTIKQTRAVLERVEGITLIESKNLSDLYEKLVIGKINLIITVDTAITHLATKKNIINIVLYKKDFWDKYSVQSFSAESPLGFCSDSPYQLPVLLNNGYMQTLGVIGNIISEMALISKNGVKDIKYDKFQNLLKSIPILKRKKLFKVAKRINVDNKINFYKNCNVIDKKGK